MCHKLQWSAVIMVSIHAPARGATLSQLQRKSKDGGFNPRARTGRDVWCAFIVYRYVVSIHAPARGATILIGRLGANVERFNPRARTGRDRALRGLRLRT